jgi:5-methylcytosine-specific restriction enzyme A
MQPNRQLWDKFYKTSRWQKARAIQLAAYPVCSRCERKGVSELANVVNHITPHKGDLVKFYNTANFESVCKPCHDGDIQREERSRFKLIGIDGWVID